ncbi:MAG: presenilin family intramembrane aspartyl protease [Promethearchaeota archaeon]|jgi:presenilin-like A22 family membrane protease
MKHNLKITAVLLLMFLATQFIGLYVIDHYTSVDLPLGLESPELEEDREYNQMFISIVIAFVIAIGLLLLLTHFKAEFLLKLWFLLVVIIALVISFMAFIPTFPYVLLVVLLLAIPLAIVKIYGQSFLIHNATELFIYPGIAAVFVPLLNIWTVIALLVAISLYDMWAVWKSGIMQKMARYQIDKLKVFSGFFVPYVSKKTRMRLKKMKKSELKKKKVKANVAILGGGDVIFPIITAGVMMKTFPETIIPAILVIIGAAIGLSYLFFFAKKKKFYPAMPFITAGIALGIGLSYLIF